MTSPFTTPGRFLKGNLHTHTTNSDGKLSPQETVDLYREHGYDFLAITDHRRLTPTDGLRADGLTLLPGMELHPGTAALGQANHMVGIGMESELDLSEATSLQAGLDFIADRCRFAFIAHPYWSSLSSCELWDIEGHIGLEVFNYTCEVGIGRGESAVHWDDLLARGRRPLGLAVDDAHMNRPDALGGWIMVKAPASDAESIIAAVIAGDFYSSSGPVIEDVNVDGSQVHVRCSPCRVINVICPVPGCGATAGHGEADDGLLSDVTLTINETWQPIRIECVDERGRKAWTNPLWPD